MTIQAQNDKIISWKIISWAWWWRYNSNKSLKFWWALFYWDRFKKIRCNFKKLSQIIQKEFELNEDISIRNEKDVKILKAGDEIELIKVDASH